MNLDTNVVCTLAEETTFELMVRVRTFAKKYKCTHSRLPNQMQTAIERERESQFRASK
jgi:hypothetical protein